MASPNVSLRQRHYQGQWNMRPPSNGEILKGKSRHQKACFMTFAWEYANKCGLLHKKAEGHGRPSVKL
jgi:hypothetical protein